MAKPLPQTACRFSTLKDDLCIKGTAGEVGLELVIFPEFLRRPLLPPGGKFPPAVTSTAQLSTLAGRPGLAGVAAAAVCPLEAPDMLHQPLVVNFSDRWDLRMERRENATKSTS